MAQQLIRRALVRAAGNKTEAANLLGIRRQQLYAKLNELGID
jgi:DNA-binding NtrC family response regulator